MRAAFGGQAGSLEGNIADAVLGRGPLAAPRRPRLPAAQVDGRHQGGLGVRAARGGALAGGGAVGHHGALHPPCSVQWPSPLGCLRGCLALVLVLGAHDPPSGWWALCMEWLESDLRDLPRRGLPHVRWLDRAGRRAAQEPAKVLPADLWRRLGRGGAREARRARALHSALHAADTEGGGAAHAIHCGEGLQRDGLLPGTLGHAVARRLEEPGGPVYAASLDSPPPRRARCAGAARRGAALRGRPRGHRAALGAAGLRATALRHQEQIGAANEDLCHLGCQGLALGTPRRGWHRPISEVVRRADVPRDPGRGS
mmetsp:Transcript_94059/g.304253  ORF Transcript_94059/g.304253 Transcript_94059/m.304253 type:complete len:313 (-) Transcript_94059:610-1548(-)